MVGVTFLLLIVIVAESGRRTRGIDVLSKLDSASQGAAVRSAKLLGNLSEAIVNLALRSDTVGRGRQADAVASGRAIERVVHGTGGQLIQTARLTDRRLGRNRLRRSYGFVEPSLHIVHESVVGHSTRSAEAVVLRENDRAVLSNRGLAWRRHLERDSVLATFIEDRTGLAMDDLFVAREACADSGRVAHDRRHVGTLQGVTALSMSKRVRSFGGRTLDPGQ